MTSRTASPIAPSRQGLYEPNWSFHFCIFEQRGVISVSGKMLSPSTPQASQLHLHPPSSHTCSWSCTQASTLRPSRPVGSNGCNLQHFNLWHGDERDIAAKRTATEYCNHVLFIVVKQICPELLLTEPKRVDRSRLCVDLFHLGGEVVVDTRTKLR